MRRFPAVGKERWGSFPHGYARRDVSSGTSDTTNRCPISFPTWGLLKNLSIF
ncbi:MAG: hypothetical protein PUP91_29800 [Rhizonema sp. PD37]|nr:hypothetical protein [Rhizonema sp. PD37]